MLIPKVSLSSLDLDELKRFLITGVTHINVDDASLSPADIQAKIIGLTRSKARPNGLQTFRNLIVGPVPAQAIDTVTALMNHGVEYIAVTGNNQDIVTVLSELQPHRVIVPETYAVTSCSDLLPGGVFIEFNGTSKEELFRAGIAVRAKECWRKSGMVIVAVTDSAVTALTAPEVEASVGVMHHQSFAESLWKQLGLEKSSSSNADHAIHIQASAAMPRASAKSETGSQICVAKSLISCLKTDRPDGLYATVVVDEHNAAIGFVYSSDESIAAALESGKGVYFSRSRKKLWRKGETSGAVQILRGIRFDCDADALKFTVIQRGDPAAFCHKQIRGCWEGEMEGLGGLFRTLISRRDTSVEGSYTKRLFTEKGLLLKKMLEEVQELDEAVNEEDPAHVAEETADVLYFALTACCAGE